MKLPELMPIDLEASNEELENQVRAIQREAAIWALEEAEKVCIEQSTAAYKLWRDEGGAYDDGGCDMAAALAADILKLKKQIE